MRERAVKFCVYSVLGFVVLISVDSRVWCLSLPAPTFSMADPPGHASGGAGTGGDRRGRPYQQQSTTDGVTPATALLSTFDSGRHWHCEVERELAARPGRCSG